MKKLNELQLTKQFKQKNMLNYGKDAEQILNQNGWRVLGRGAEGAVAEHPNKSYVLKLFRKNSLYNHFVNLVQHSNNIHFPFFSRFVKPVPGTMYNYVRMEKLTPVNSQILLDNFFPELCDVEYVFPTGFGNSTPAVSLYSSVTEIFYDEYNNDFSTVIKDQHQPDQQWVDALESIKKLKHPIDFHSGNFMLRGNILVITDPIIDN